MDKPNKVMTPPAVSPTSTQSPMPVYIADPSLKGVSFDQLLNQRGIRMIHQKAIPCPNINSTEDNAHMPQCSFCDDSGLIYYAQKEILGVFQGNTLEKTFEYQGIWEIGSAVVTLPTEYTDGTQSDFNTFDRLVIPDFTVRMYEMKEYEPRVDNKQKMRYPIQKVDFMTAINGNSQIVYQLGVHFTLTLDGAIQWLPGQEPAYDNINERGEVYTVSYYASPVYAVLQTLRELRITQEMDAAGLKIARRLPQQVLVRRDYFSNPAETLKNISS